MPERLECEVLQKARYINTLTFTFTFYLWPLMGGLLRLVQRREDWAGPQPTQAPPRCTKCIVLYCYMMIRCSAVLTLRLKG